LVLLGWTEREPPAGTIPVLREFGPEAQAG
jgi:hypothetical protein